MAGDRPRISFNRIHHNNVVVVVFVVGLHWCQIDERVAVRMEVEMRLQVEPALDTRFNRVDLSQRKVCK